MPGKKEVLRARGKLLMKLAHEYRARHPNAMWKVCVAEAGKMYRSMKK